MKAVDLKVGMELEDGSVVESIDIFDDGTMDVCLSCIDHDCGEVEYFPISVSIDDEF